MEWQRLQTLIRDCSSRKLLVWIYTLLLPICPKKLEKKKKGTSKIKTEKTLFNNSGEHLAYCFNKVVPSFNKMKYSDTHTGFNQINRVIIFIKKL